MKLETLLNQNRLTAYAAYLKAQGLSPATINRKLSSLSTFQKFLIKKKYLSPQLVTSSTLTSNPVTSSTPASVAPSSPTSPSRSLLKHFSSRLSSFHSNRPVLTYTLIATLIIALGALGYGLYYQSIVKAKLKLAYSSASSPIRPSRILSFQGRLTDTSGNPITSTVPIEFRLYDSDVGGTSNVLYDSWTNYGEGIGATTVTPDENGIFSVVIGKSHGSPIPSTVFSEHAEVWLGITVSGETMAQRQQIATVAYALNADTLQGLPPSASGLKNTVLVIDGNGNVNLGETSPTIVSNSGTFGIVGQSLLIGTTDLSDGNITINPDGAGILKLVTEGTGSTAVGGFIEATNANLQAGNLYSGLIRNTNRTYNFLSFQNYNIGTTQLDTRFSVDASGNTYTAGSLSAASLAIGGTNVTSTASEINLLDGTLATVGTIIFGDGTKLANTGVGVSGQVLMSAGNSAPAWVTLPAAINYTANNGLTLNSTVFELGGNLTKNTQIGTSSFNLSFLGLGNSQSLSLASSGNVGIGLTNATHLFDVFGNRNDYLGYIYNVGTSSSSGGLYIRTDGLGDLLTLNSNGTDMVKISPSSAQFNLPTTFTSTGDVSLANNLNFTNQTASYLRSNAPLYLEAGENFESSDLTLRTFNLGQVVVDSSALNVGGTFIYAQGAQAGYVLRTDAAGAAYWADAASVGSTYVAGLGLTLNPGSTFNINLGIGLTVDNQNKLGINYANANTWTGLNTFTSGLDVSGNTSLTNNLTIGGTFVSVGSTNLVTNLNANYLNGVPSTGFVGIGQTGNFITTLNNGVGISISGSGVSRTIAVDYDTTLALSGNKLALNLGSTNSWTARQYFSGGIGVSGYAGFSVGIGVTGNSYFTNAVGVTGNLTIGGTFVSVGSTNLVTNLNADVLDGQHSSYFVNIGQTGSLPYVNNTADTTLTRAGTGPYTLALNLGSTNVWTALQSFSVGIGVTGNSTFQNSLSIGQTLTTANLVATSLSSNQLILGGGAGNLTSLSTGTSGQVLMSNGAGSVPVWSNFSGDNWGSQSVVTNTTLTGNGTVGTPLGLNLASANTWTALQNFGLGIGVTGNAAFQNNLTIGGTFVSVGSTNLVTNLNANYLNGYAYNALPYEAPLTFTNGLTRSTNTIGLGGTLTANTNINLASSSLSFLGTGDTQSLFLAANGNIGLGTTLPGGKFEINTPSTTGATALILRTDNSPTANSTIRWQDNAGNNEAGIGSNFNVADAGALEFLNGTTTNMIIRSTGNVGIGNTNPQARLDVNGNANIATSLNVGTSLNVAGNANIGGTLSLPGTPTGIASDMSALLLNVSNQVVRRTLNQIAFDGQLSLVGGLGIGVTGIGVGTTINLDPTELGVNLTFGTGSTFTWTFNSGTTQPSIAFRNNALDFTGNQMNTTTVSSTRNFTRSVGTSTVTLDAGSTFSVADFGRMIYWPDGTVNRIVSITGGTATIDANSAASGTSQPTIKNANLYLDSLANKIGINTANPREALEVNGNIAAEKFTDLTMFDKYYLDPANSSDNASTLSLHRNGSIRFNSYYSSGWKYIAAGPAQQILSVYSDTTVPDNGARLSGLYFMVSDTGPADGTITGSFGLYLNSRVGYKGNLGLGTTDPKHLLDIKAPLSFTLPRLDGTNATVVMNAGTSLAACVGTPPTCDFATYLSAGDPIEIGGTNFIVASVIGTSSVTVATTTPTTISNALIRTGSNLINVSDHTGQSRLFLGRNGRLGLGTTSPQAHLDIAGSVSQISNTAGDITINAASNNISLAGDNLINANNGYFAGNVGIGNSEPTTQLDVTGSGNFSDNLTVTNTTSTNSLYANDRIGIGISSAYDRLHIASETSNNTNIRLDYTSLDINAGDIYGSLLFTGNDASANASGTRAMIEAKAKDSSGATNLNFYTSNSGSSAVANLTLDANGNMGLGVSSPDPNTAFHIYRATGDANIRLQSGATNYLDILNSSTFGLMGYGTNDLIFGTAGAEHLRLDINGNLGLGTTSPAAKFDIQAQTDTSGLIVNQQGNGDLADFQLNAHSVFGIDNAGVITVGSGLGETSSGWAVGSTHAYPYVEAMSVFNGRLYAGYGVGGSYPAGAGNGDLWYCDPSKAGNIQICDSAADWTISFNGSQEAILSMAVFRDKLYIGQGNGPGDGDVYVCDPTSTGNTEVCDTTDWTLAFDGGQEMITSMSVYNNRLYIGQGWNSGDADIYRCNPAANDTCTITDWTRVYDGGNGVVWSMSIFEGQLFAGLGNGSSQGDVVNTYDNGTTAALVWRSSYSATGYESALRLTVFNGRLFKGAGNSTGDGNVVYLSTANGGWSNAWNGSQEQITALMPYNGKIYAGQGNSVGDGDIFVSEIGYTNFKTSYDGAKGQIYAMAVFNNVLYAGESLQTGITGVVTGSPSSILYMTEREDQSYPLKFLAGSGSDQRTGSILFTSDESRGGPTDNNAVFKFSHQVITAANAFDIAEDYPTNDPSLSSGDLASADPNVQGFVQKTGKYTKGSFLGVVSTKPGFRLSGDNLLDNVPLALSGRVPVRIDPDSSEIKVGDMIAISDKGMATKATKAGYVIGKALANWTPGTTSMVDMFINNTYYDPGLELTDLGQLNIDTNIDQKVLSFLGYHGAKNEIESAEYYLKDTDGNILDRVGSFSKLMAAKIETGLLSAQNIVAKTILSETSKSKSIETARITPLSDLTDTIAIDGNASVSGKLNANEVFTNKIGATEASFGTLYVNRIISKEGDFGEVMTGKITALRDELKKFITTQEASSSSDITGSTLLAQSESWKSYISFESSSSATIDGSLALSDSLVVGSRLTVLGDTQLGNAFITGTFTAGEIAIKDNFIETANTALYIQPSAIGSVHIMGDTLVIADNGDITINGNLAINGVLTAREASVSGSLFANLIRADELEVKNATVSGVANLNEIKVSTDSATTVIAQSGFANLATSSAKMSSNATAGTATLPAGKTEIIIYNQKLSPTSMVYLTPNGSTQNQVVYVKSKSVQNDLQNEATSSGSLGSYFTIAIDSPLPQNIDINWWIIN